MKHEILNQIYTYMNKIMCKLVTVVSSYEKKTQKGILKDLIPNIIEKEDHNLIILVV